ncbi:alpha/beta hydrolase [Kribbella sp. NBC_00709]|uniref:alpha/beta hydrolase n=1 Tax=Kribbella sp. NBC_00709 TaxID=2975972 RepID=UPI002E29EB02|nr:alpha/beta hydrolase [Kribbella sp. NBC_00709]
MTTTPTPAVPTDHPARQDSGRKGHIGRVVASSLAIGLVAALLLVAAPFIPAEISEVTGAVLCGFALGWALLAVLSTRFTDQPQQWAAIPAMFMGVGGLLLVAFGSGVDAVLNWVWPPALLALAIWMAVRVRRQLRSRSGRWLLYPVIALLALAAIGGGYETVRQAADTKAYPMPGQLIDVGGHSLHLNCTGSGSPTVVLEAGGGEMSSNLGWIMPAVAGTTRVCVYDRAGRGWSEAADVPQDGTQIAIDLHTLLQRGNIPGPYVLAGHSFGGLYVRTFAARYPNDVAGLVLVDSTAAGSATQPGTTSVDDAGSYDALGRVSALISSSARLGLARLYGQLSYGSLPPRSRDEARATGSTASNLRSTIDEYVQANASIDQAATLQDFAGKPLVVVTAGSGNDAAWQAKQKDMAALSTNSAHRVISGATHEALVAEQEYSAATSQAILDVVSAVRGRGQLSN